MLRRNRGLLIASLEIKGDQYTRMAGDGPGAFLKIKNGTKARGIETNLRKPDLYVKKNLDLNLCCHSGDPEILPAARPPRKPSPRARIFPGSPGIPGRLPGRC